MQGLNDRITELCSKALQAEGRELESILAELNAALQQHTEELRSLAAQKLITQPK